MIDMILRQSLILTYVGIVLMLTGGTIFFTTLGVWMWSTR